VIHIAADGSWAVSRTLRQECDDLIEIGGSHLRPYVSLSGGTMESPALGNGLQQITNSQSSGSHSGNGQGGASHGGSHSGNGQTGGSHSGNGAAPTSPIPAAQTSRAAHSQPALPAYPSYTRESPALPVQPPPAPPAPPSAAPNGPTGPLTAAPQYSLGNTGGMPSYQASQLGAYTGPQAAPVPIQTAATSGTTTLSDAVKAAHKEGHDFGESVAKDAPALWLEAVLARKPRMPSDLEARLLQGSSLPIDFLLHDEVRHALRRGFWDALERARR
jgi:hypothetical protein